MNVGVDVAVAFVTAPAVRSPKHEIMTITRTGSRTLEAYKWTRGCLHKGGVAIALAGNSVAHQ